MKATIIHVADEAGVSVATVSRVVNGNYPVREETRKKVQLAIDRLQYLPNIQARELNMQCSTSIGVVVPSLYNMFFAEVINGIEDRLQSESYSLLLCCAKNNSEKEAKCINELMSRNVSGIIVISPNTENVETKFYDRIVKQQALVFINSYVKIPDISYVSSDEDMGMRRAIRHLLDYGHKKILFVRGVNSDSYRIKEAAYCEVMREKGIFNPDYIINIGEGNSTDTVDNTMYKLMDMMLHIDVTAMLCCNDLMAVGAVNACKKMGRSIPMDISIIGYDNISLSHFIEPKLTTMDQNMFALGSNAAELLIEKIKTGISKRVVLDNVLVERETTGPCLLCK
jgi:LacI family transcriptional regulator